MLLEATSIGLQIAWAAGTGPGSGLQAGFAAPGLALDIDGTTVPLPVPQVASNGTVTMPPEAWASLETALSLLAARSPAWWLASVVELMGWGPAATGPHLALADVAAAPETALLGWARSPPGARGRPPATPWCRRYLVRAGCVVITGQACCQAPS